MAQAIQLVDDVDTVRLKPDPTGRSRRAKYHKKEKQKKRIIQRKPIHTKEAIFFTSNHRIPFFSSFFFVVLRLPLSLPSPVGLASAGRHGHTPSRRLCRYRQAEA
jgi:hypothetical protein